MGTWRGRVGCGPVNPEELRKEAAAAEFLARMVSYARDKERLTARAAELRAQADAMEDGGAKGPQQNAAEGAARGAASVAGTRRPR